MSGHSLSFRTAGSLAKQDLHTDFEGVVAPSSSDLDGTAYDSFPIAPEPRAGMLCVSAYESLKRGLDIALSLTALIVLSPFLALIALAIKLQDGGSILFAQDRVGKNGKIFRFYKFRSMVRDADWFKD
jgi:lipopolysaccharide/colanic/teichoic acid biosynthesis glycosyltransferase